MGDLSKSEKMKTTSSVLRTAEIQESPVKGFEFKTTHTAIQIQKMPRRLSIRTGNANLLAYIIFQRLWGSLQPSFARKSSTYMVGKGPRSTTLSHLENDGGSGLELQHARHAERLELRVGVVDEVGVVERHQRLNVVQLEAELVGSLGDLLMPGQVDGQLGRLAQHGRLTDDLTQLDGGRGRRERRRD